MIDYDIILKEIKRLENELKNCQSLWVAVEIKKEIDTFKDIFGEA